MAVKSYYYSIYVYPKRGVKFIERCHWENYQINTFNRWKWYFRYRAALLQIKYPKYIVDQSWGAMDADKHTKEFIEAKILKNDIMTCKRMITKISNAIKNYEAEENKKLLPFLDNQKYIRTKEKLKEYRNKLDKLNNQVK